MLTSLQRALEVILFTVILFPIGIYIQLIGWLVSDWIIGWEKWKEIRNIK